MDHSNNLQVIDSATPTTMTTVAVSGLGAGEALIGIDYRPADGMLYAVGSTGRIYTVNPATGRGCQPPRKTAVPDPLHVVCPHCDKTNRLPAARLAERLAGRGMAAPVAAR